LIDYTIFNIIINMEKIKVGILGATGTVGQR